MSSFSFPKEEKLKSVKAISHLFENGKPLHSAPLRAFYILVESDSDPVKTKAAFSVSKRTFKRAVDRNLLKRRMREAYRKNKQILDSGILADSTTIHIIFLYSGSIIQPYLKIEDSLKNILLRLKERLD